MALDNFKCNHLMSLHFKGLTQLVALTATLQLTDLKDSSPEWRSFYHSRTNC